MSKVNTAGVIRLLNKKGSKLSQVMRQSMIDGMRNFEAKIIKEQMRGGSGVKKVSGRLSGDWFIRQSGSGAEFRVTLASPTKYARIHQFGGVIRPTTAKNLAIPVKGSASQGALAQGPRNTPGLKFFVGPKGPYLGKKAGSPMFLLRKSVTIPKRLKIFEAFRASGGKIIRAALNDNIKRVLKAA